MALEYNAARISPLKKALLMSTMRYINGIYIDDTALVTGDVQIGADTNLWPFVSARGDVAPIRVGTGCSVQDHVMLHCKYDVALTIGDHVLIGHHAVVHCTSVGDWTLIGIGARVLDDAVVGKNCIVAAGAVVRPGMVIADNTLVAGVPAKVIREVTESDREYIKNIVTRYVDLAKGHIAGKFPRKYV